MPEQLNYLFKEWNEYDQVRRDLDSGKGPVSLSGCIDAAKPHLISGFGEEKKWKLVITYNEARAKELYEDSQFYGGMYGSILLRISFFIMRISRGNCW